MALGRDVIYLDSNLDKLDPRNHIFEFDDVRTVHITLRIRLPTCRNGRLWERGLYYKGMTDTEPDYVASSDAGASSGISIFMSFDYDSGCSH